MAEQRKRKKYFVDRKVQGGLVARAARYWITSIALVGALTTLGWVFVFPGIGGILNAREQMASLYPVFVIALIVSLGLLPLVLFDLIRMSNRFVGPMVRMRQYMKDLAEGRPVQSISFREGDYWHEFAELFNDLIKRVEVTETEPERASEV